MSTAAQPPVAGYGFGNFVLDVARRQLWRNGQPVPLNSRYFDVLVLLVREQGVLVRKEQLFAEVWHDVVVTDAALTQCIKDLRRQLGDDAAQPTFIRTVTKHGYLFVAPVTPLAAIDLHDEVGTRPDVQAVLARVCANHRAHGLLPDGATLDLLLAEGTGLQPSAEAAQVLARSLLRQGRSVPPWLVPLLDAVGPLLDEGLHHPDLAVQRAAIRLLVERNEKQAVAEFLAATGQEASIRPLALLREQAPALVPLHRLSMAVRVKVLGVLAGIRLYEARRAVLRQVVGGTAGGVVAGGLGGVLYGLALAVSWTAAQPDPVSLVLLFVVLGIGISALGGLGISAGMATVAAAGARHSRWWGVPGGMVGGALVGGVGRWGARTFLLTLFGEAPVQVTGAGEGALIGLAVSAGALLADRMPFARHPRLAVLGAALVTALLFLLMALAGARLFIGSLAAFTSTFADSFVQLDALAYWFGQPRFGPTTQWMLSALEGLVFGGGVVGGLVLSQRLNAH